MGLVIMQHNDFALLIAAGCRTACGGTLQQFGPRCHYQVLHLALAGNMVRHMHLYIATWSSSHVVVNVHMRSAQAAPIMVGVDGHHTEPSQLVLVCRLPQV